MFKSLKHTLSVRKSAEDNTSVQSPITPTEDAHPQARRFVPTRRRQAPPPYSELPPSYAEANDTFDGTPVSTSTTSNASARPVEDDRFSFLAEFDTVILIDDSGSMAGANWRDTGAALESILEKVIKYDENGIDIYFLHQPEAPEHKCVRDTERVRSIFRTVRPGGGTPLGVRLDKIVRPYLEDYEDKPRREKPKPMNIICITDGEPGDDLQSTIEYAAKTLDDLRAPAWQLGIQFFQIGQDADATRYLNELDDNLQKTAGIRDIVDTVPYGAVRGNVTFNTFNQDDILKILLGAVDRRWDRKKAPGAVASPV